MEDDMQGQGSPLNSAFQVLHPGFASQARLPLVIGAKQPKCAAFRLTSLSLPHSVL